MKKLLSLLILTLLTALALPAAATCTISPQPVGHAGSGKVWKIVGSGSNLLVTYGNPNGFSSTKTIQFGAASEMTFVGTWVSATGMITSMSSYGHAWPDSPQGGGVLVFNNSGLNDIEIHKGAWLGSQGNWSDGVRDVTGLGLGQRSLTFAGINNGVTVTRTYSAVGYCSNYMDQRDLGAVGLALMPQEKMRREWWMP